MNDLMQKPKVSIISGLYNVGKFLREKKLKCILNQTYTNWELLLIDDGSQDDTLSLCKELAAKNENIKVYHQKNQGIGCARNVGLNAATGDYIWFYDVDDDVEPDLIEYCVNEIEKRKTDLLVFSFHTITPHLRQEEQIYLKEKEINNQQELRNYWLDYLLFVPNGNGFVWNKFYRRSFLEQNHLRLGDQRIQQDEIFNLRVYSIIEKIYISPKILYHYYIYNKGNIRNGFIYDRFSIYKDVYNQFRRLQQHWNIKDNRLEIYLYRRFFYGIGQCLNLNIFLNDCNLSNNEKKEEIHRIMNDTTTIATLDFLKSNGELSWEESFYITLYKKENPCLLQAGINLFSILRYLKLKITSRKPIHISHK